MFNVFLPRVDLPAEPTRGRARRPSSAAPETVLLVEDEPLVREIAESALSDQGYQVLEAEHGEEALRVAGEHGDEIPLVLTDVVMPKMGGRELVEQLRKVRPGIRVLYMSGYAASIDDQDVIEPGTSFLRKPFTLADMLRKVREVLDATRAPVSGTAHGGRRTAVDRRLAGHHALLLTLERSPVRLLSTAGRSIPVAARLDRDTEAILQGTLDMLVLRALQLEPMHGWGITERIEQWSEEVLSVGQGTLYPALYRLERQGLISSAWDVTANNRRARYYKLTAAGRRHVVRELESWRRLSRAIDLVLRATEA